MKRKALGRGLSAILPQPPVEKIQERRIQEIPVEVIRENHLQPRTVFFEEELEGLSRSIREQGMLQPLLVRDDPQSSGQFQLIAGERRLRAAKMAGLVTVPCVVMKAGDEQMLEIALVENIQRADLNPVEEARAYLLLSEQYSLTQEAIATRVGKSREAVANSMRLLNLPPTVLEALEDGRIMPGHAKCLLALRDAEQIKQFADTIIRKGLSVRETERLLQSTREPQEKTTPQKTPPDTHVAQLVKVMEEKWQTKVRVKMQGKKKGVIEIHFYDLDHLDGLLKKWKISLD